MRVTILESQPKDSSRTDVRFGSPFGEALARWASETPAVQGVYDVEFTVSDPVEWSRTAIAVDGGAPSISMTADGVRLCGTLDDVQEDGVVALRLGDSVILVETVGQPPPAGSSVCITVKEVELYAYET